MKSYFENELDKFNSKYIEYENRSKATKSQRIIESKIQI